MAVLQGAPEQQLNITVLNKALFYLDLAALRDFGKTVTGAKYIALENGPVVAQYDKKLVRDLAKLGLVTENTVGLSKPLRVAQPLDSFPALTDQVVEMATQLGSKFAAATSTSVSQRSHKNHGWIYAYDSYRTVGKPETIDMLAALQDFDDDDDWLNEPLDADMHASVKDAHTATISL